MQLHFMIWLSKYNDINIFIISNAINGWSGLL